MTPSPVLWRCITALVVAATLAPAAAFAHHSSAMFDFEQEVTVEGVVTRYDWANPHVYIYFNVAEDDGSILEWEVEGFPPAFLRRVGWSRDTLAPGDAITVSGNPSRRDNLLSLYPSFIARGDETLLDRRALVEEIVDASSPEPVSSDGLSGVWIAETSLEDLLDPENMALTDAGAAAAEAFDETTMHPGLQCIPMPPPASMYIRDVKEVVVGDDEVRIGTEFDGVERVIHIDSAPDEANADPPVHGVSVGRWVTGDLVVETTGFAPHAVGAAFGLPSGPNKALFERFTLSEDGATLTYAFELMDPEFMAEPVAAESVWVYRPDVTFAPEACVLENARRFAEE